MMLVAAVFGAGAHELVNILKIVNIARINGSRFTSVYPSTKNILLKELSIACQYGRE
jgi:hypothetical protein